MLEFVCPGCQSVVSLEDHLLGSRIRCKCGHVFQAGRAPEKPAVPPTYSAATAETIYNPPQIPVKSPPSYNTVTFLSPAFGLSAMASEQTKEKHTNNVAVFIKGGLRNWGR